MEVEIVKRLALLFLILMALPVLACGGGSNISGWEQQVKLPAEKSHPEVLQAMEQMWQPTAAAATATMAAGSTQAASYAATVEAIQTLLPPVTPTLAPARAFVHKVSDDEYVIAIASLYGPNCSIEGIKTLNNLDDEYKISVGQILTLPDGCMLPTATPAPATQ